ncbi:glycosyltransferase family 2 protein [Geosporobacter ferrireducens]|uniref:Glycosyltransferase 2-like domain-containing protein n=1 Tax=Geosporobacter ferrireducens TaxID=1424294 RepID=A0A1D8GER5_9FIRM|nr:glycosyltransferase family 2 protein [Geosporobacter ferrireducens]AOT69411.1 hypothetical protein Gferi_07385 [Geosporobacter ferrireducens]MTI56521.1 glycosyltransferase family 2 protein [Geosporobacter ferrireducens]
MVIQISVVIPVYNSEKTLAELILRLTHTLQKLCTIQYEIILVDDHSQDDSYRELQRLKKHHPQIKLIQLERNFSQQNALMCGLHYAEGTFIITMDDDLQHPPEEIEKLLKKLEEGYDVVFGIPIKKNHPKYRNVGTKLIRWLFNKICAKPSGVQVSSFRIMRRNIVKQLILNTTSFVYLAPIIFKVTSNVADIPVIHDQRKCGESNYNPYTLIKLFIKVILYYSSFSKYLPFPKKPQFVIKNIQW